MKQFPVQHELFMAQRRRQI